MKPTGELTRYQQRVGGSGVYGDVFRFIETVPATDYDALATAHAALVQRCAELERDLGEQMLRNDTQRIAATELRAKCAELEAWADGPNGVKWYIQQAADLRAKLQAAERDVARLDFLHVNGLGCDKIGHAQPIFDVWLYGTRYTADNPRAAIDAAQSAKGEGE